MAAAMTETIKADFYDSSMIFRKIFRNKKVKKVNSCRVSQYSMRETIN